MAIARRNWNIWYVMLWPTRWPWTTMVNFFFFGLGGQGCKWLSWSTTWKPSSSVSKNISRVDNDYLDHLIIRINFIHIWCWIDLWLTSLLGPKWSKHKSTDRNFETLHLAPLVWTNYQFDINCHTLSPQAHANIGL